MWEKAPISILQGNNALKSTQALKKRCICMYTELIIGFKCVNDRMENLFKQIIDSASEDQRDGKAATSR